MNAVTLKKVADNFNQSQKEAKKRDAEIYFEAICSTTLRPLAEKGLYNADIRVPSDIDGKYLEEVMTAKGFKFRTMPNAPLGTIIISW